MPTALASADVVLYVELVTLPPECQPARVRRKHGRTLLWCDPARSRAEVSRYCLENLTSAELAYLWTVYGPAETYVNDSRPLIPRVPDVLRLPRAAAGARVRSA